MPRISLQTSGLGTGAPSTVDAADLGALKEECKKLGWAHAILQETTYVGTVDYHGTTFPVAEMTQEQFDWVSAGDLASRRCMLRCDGREIEIPPDSHIPKLWLRERQGRVGIQQSCHFRR